jgi:hypothetical protein
MDVTSLKPLNNIWSLVSSRPPNRPLRAERKVILAHTDPQTLEPRELSGVLISRSDRVGKPLACHTRLSVALGLIYSNTGSALPSTVYIAKYRHRIVFCFRSFLSEPPSAIFLSYFFITFVVFTYFPHFEKKSILMRSCCCLCVCLCIPPPPIVGRQRLGTNVTAVTNTYAIEELLDASFSMWPLYQGK